MGLSYGSGRGRRGLLTLAAALCCGWACASSDIVADIARCAPPAGFTYTALVEELHSLQKNPRVKLDCAGRTPQGRSLPVAIVHDPAVPLDRLVRIFIIARQHGGEEAGMTAAVALLRYFARSQDQLACDLRRQMALVMVPVANPDGMVNWRRANSGGADLNRDWSVFSQVETRAIAAAVRKYRPHALIDMHELPVVSGKPAYRDNFIQTIGKSTRLSVELSGDCATTSARLAAWMGRGKIPVSLYYDEPGDSLNLCHRYFGLACGIPSYLFEAKCGTGRPLAKRAQFHILGTLIVADYALHRYYEPPAEGQLVATPEPPSAPLPALPPPGPVAVTLEAPALQPVARGQLPLVAKVNTLPEGSYLLFHVDGQMKALTNAAPHEYLLDTRAYADGQHEVAVEVCDAAGKVVCQTRTAFVIDNQGEAVLGE